MVLLTCLAVVVCLLVPTGKVSSGIDLAGAASVEIEQDAALCAQDHRLDYDAAETDRVLADIQKQKEQTRHATSGAAHGQSPFSKRSAMSPTAEDLLQQFQGALQKLDRLEEQRSNDRHKKVLSDTIDKAGPFATGYAKAMLQFTRAGGAEPATLHSVQDIDARLAMLEVVEAATIRQRQAYENIEGNLRGRLEGEGEDPAAIASFLRFWRSTKQLDLLFVTQKRGERVTQELRGLLETYREGWGQWRVDPQTGLTFDTVSLLDRYRGHGERIQQATRESREAKRLLIQQARAAQPLANPQTP